MGQVHFRLTISPTSTKLVWMTYLRMLTTMHGPEAASAPHFMLSEQGEVFSDAAKEEFASHVAEKALTAVTKRLDEDGVCEVELFLENDPISINQKLIDGGLVQAYSAADIEEEDSEPEILQLPEDNQWDIYVSFINSSTNSVMVRLIGDQYSELLEEHELKLEEAFHSAGDTPTEFKVDQVCVAYVDELYHRVRVLKKEGKWIEVFFLDHGDTDKVIPDQLRPLDPASNKSLPYQVIEVSLYGLEDPSISENVGALEMVFDLALGKTCVADVVSRDSGISLVLYDTSGEQDININELIKKTCSKEAKQDNGTVISKDVSEIIKENSDKLDTKPKSISSSSDVLSSSTTNPSSTPLHVDTSPRSRESSQKRTPKTTPSTSPGQSSSKSPKSPASSSAKSKQKNYWPSPAKAKPVKNEDEDSWETESEEEEVKDSGKTEVHGGKKDVNSNLKNPSKESKTNSTTEENTDIVNNSGNPSANNVQDIANAAKNVDENDKKLYTWGKPSSGATPGDEWDAQSYNQRQIPPKVKVPDPKNYWDVHVVNVFDPSNFICIPFDGMIPLTDMLKSMMEYFSNIDNSKVLSTEDLKLNHMYAGHQNGAWYRVIIGHVVANDLVSAYLCDFGEYTVMAIDEVKPLPAVYWDQPRLAYKCKLHGVKPSKGSALWSEAAKYKFRSMAHNNSLVAFIDSISDDEIVSLRLVDTAGSEDACLDEVLLTSGFAEKIKS
ncbi:hypothetical protein FSP39_004943 [Pinctada imbricata]|uniref:Tudor domain-containing protein n=1 Tax=Pinctada imbricata TaxID=66713 RepID=A0AA88Y1B7_PINIB|nr:hypothetical protein FSP39_004943 [Pinctada imbricata]